MEIFGLPYKQFSKTQTVPAKFSYPAVSLIKEIKHKQFTENPIDLDQVKSILTPYDCSIVKVHSNISDLERQAHVIFIKIDEVNIIFLSHGAQYLCMSVGKKGKRIFTAMYSNHCMQADNKILCDNMWTMADIRRIFPEGSIFIFFSFFMF